MRPAAWLALCALLAGCAAEPVRPWQRGVLARPDMAADGDPLQSRFAAHAYQSKEGASGGQGIGGGGCGCN